MDLVKWSDKDSRPGFKVQQIETVLEVGITPEPFLTTKL